AGLVFLSTIILFGASCSDPSGANSVTAVLSEKEQALIKENVDLKATNAELKNQAVEAERASAQNERHNRWARQIETLWQRNYPTGTSLDDMVRALLVKIIPNNGDPKVLDRYKVFAVVKHPTKDLKAVLVGNIPGVLPNGDCCRNPRGFFIVDKGHMTRQWYLAAHPFFDPTYEYPYIKNVRWVGNKVMFDEVQVPLGVYDRDGAVMEDESGEVIDPVKVYEQFATVTKKQFVVGEEDGLTLEDLNPEKEIYSGEITVTGNAAVYPKEGEVTKYCVSGTIPENRYLIPRDSGERKEIDFCLYEKDAASLGLPITNEDAQKFIADSQKDSIPCERVGTQVQLTVTDYVHYQWDDVNKTLGIRGDRVYSGTDLSDQVTLKKAQVLNTPVCVKRGYDPALNDTLNSGDQEIAPK
ncbi:MAG: hypothetical protein V1821_04070, partial [bacterium]